MAINFKVWVKASATPAQWRQILIDMGGSGATGPTRVFVRKIRNQLKAALLETKHQREVERPEIAATSARLPGIDQQITDIDAALPDFEDD